MDKIRQLFQAMSSSDIRLLKQHLSVSSHRSGKSLKFISILEKQPDCSEEMVFKSLYKKANRKAFNMLKSRLFEKMLHVMVLNEGCPKEQLSGEQLILYASLLRQKGLYDTAFDFLKKCLTFAEIQGIPELSFLALMQMRLLPQSGTEHEVHYQRKFNKALAALHTDVLGSEVFDKWQHTQIPEDNKQVRKQKLLMEKELSQLEHHLTSTYTPRSHYFYLYTHILQLQRQGNYTKAKTILSELLALVESHPSLSNPLIISDSYLLASKLAIHFYEFEESKSAAKHVIKISHLHHSNYFQANIILVYSYIFLGKLTDAQSALKHLPRINKNIHSFPNLQDITNYLQACIYFLRLRFSESHRETVSISSLFNDKKGWNPALRVFELIILMENQDYDQILDKLESFRKYIQRHQVSGRSKLFYQFFTVLAKNLYYFDRHSRKMNNILMEIQHSTKWNPLGYEIIKADTWIISKLKQTEYYDHFLSDIRKNHGA